MQPQYIVTSSPSSQSTTVLEVQDALTGAALILAHLIVIKRWREKASWTGALIIRKLTETVSNLARQL